MGGRPQFGGICKGLWIQICLIGFKREEDKNAAAKASAASVESPTMQGLFLKNQEPGREHQPFNAEAEWAKKHLLICVLNYALDRTEAIKRSILQLFTLWCWVHRSENWFPCRIGWPNVPRSDRTEPSQAETSRLPNEAVYCSLRCVVYIKFKGTKAHWILPTVGSRPVPSSIHQHVNARTYEAIRQDPVRMNVSADAMVIVYCGSSTVCSAIKIRSPSVRATSAEPGTKGKASFKGRN